MPSNPTRAFKSLTLIFATTLTLIQTTKVNAQDYETLAPFSEVRWDKDGLPVGKIDKKWYSVKAINGVTSKSIMEFCKKTWPSKTQKRFEEDLVEVLSKMGHPPKSAVTLKVIDLKTGREQTLENVEMTGENRRALKKTRDVADRAALHVKKALRQWDANKDGKIQLSEIKAGSARAQWAKMDLNKDRVLTVSELKASYLKLREERRERGNREVTALPLQQALADVNDFQRQLESRFAYLNASNVDYKSALDGVRNRLKQSGTKPISVADLEAEIGKVISLFIDGHAGPRGFHEQHRRGPTLPFILEIAGDRFVAVNPNRKSLVDAEHPYLIAMDGISIERWLAAMDPYVNPGSPQNVRRRSARYLEFLAHARERLGLPAAKQLEVQLASGDGTKKIKRKLDLSKKPPRTIELPFRKCQILDGNIGYLSLPTFSGSPNAVSLVKRWMPKFQKTNGLIIDVRDNGGGTRQGLLELFPYFLNPGESRVGNICAYRLYSEFGKDHLAARYAYKESDPRWNRDELATIRKFKKSFRPEWQFDKAKFSEWHYLLLSKRADDPRYTYERPIVLITNSYCFSATDIFVGAFKDFRNVTIMGQSTGGGSARTQREKLPNSGIQIRLASMASYQPSGLLYDGRGVAVDVRVDPKPESFLLEGKDNVLQTAIQFLKSKSPEGK